MASHAFYMMMAVLACLLVPTSCQNDQVQMSSRAKTVNCEKYPYAPRCRGVSAKRSHLSATTFHDAIPGADNTDEMVLHTYLSSVRNLVPRRESLKVERLESLLYQMLLAQEQRLHQSDSLQDD